MKKIILCILLSLNITGAKADTIAVDGINRSYILDQTSKAIGPAPLIVALHGSGGSAAQFRRFSNLGNVGNTYGINVVFADGVNHQWNDGRANIGTDANDIGFLTALVNQLVTKGLADPNHVIFTGMSNGGIMSYTMACRSSLRIYAIAPVSANIGEGMTCTNTQARLLNIVGTEDKLVPMAGGNVAGVLQRGTVQSSQASFQAFLNANGCSSKSSVPMPDLAVDNMLSVANFGTGCARNPVAQIVVTGGGHAWAGSPAPLALLTGKPTMDFSATQLVVRLAKGEKLTP